MDAPRTARKASSPTQLASDDKSREQEASSLAKVAVKAREKATQLAQAAIAAGDPQERQKLLNQALQAEIEAESFGKTAKWLSSGTAQGLIVGTGFGSIPGISLGVITGTLVGGLTTLITGGLGGAIGAGIGAVHGPFWKVSDVAGDALNKVLPNIPGWTASDEQKYALEELLGQVKQQEQPSAEELDSILNMSSHATHFARQPLRRNEEDATAYSASQKEQSTGRGPPPKIGKQENKKTFTDEKKRKPRKLERRTS